ncbi:hypothetical protein BAE44_0004654 [Dichanthelium oligosanthes]|uniref:Uncharacterized protein n=1 Tax=Dichanthelium oligosanthes TaxID=888268 RepID=A0A1E5WAC3_9POAL|nr:hypothetical protein BAE44_0004654 [Dichanthelium oligosanthes]
MANRRCVARNKLSMKMTTFAPAEISNKDPQLILRKILHAEMKVRSSRRWSPASFHHQSSLTVTSTFFAGLCSPPARDLPSSSRQVHRRLVSTVRCQQASSAVVSIDFFEAASLFQNLGSALPDGTYELVPQSEVKDEVLQPEHLDGRFLATDDRSKATKVEKTMCAKRRKTMPLAEIVIEPKMSTSKMSNLFTRVASLSSNMPPRILELLKKECTGHEDQPRIHEAPDYVGAKEVAE